MTLPVRPPEVPAAVWHRINPPAKQRLVADGPRSNRIEIIEGAIYTVAMELRILGVEQHVAVRICSNMPVAPKRSSERREIRKQIVKTIRDAYHRPVTLKSGCPQTSDSPSKMRDSFKDYCDDYCQTKCKILRANYAPESIIADSPYYATMISPIWLNGHQGGLGVGAKTMWILLASMAIMEPTEEIQASLNYIVRRLGGSANRRSLQRHNERLRRTTPPLLTLVSRKNGVYRVPALSTEELRDLEDTLGAREAAHHNVQVAIASSEHRNENWPAWDAAAIEAERRYGLQPAPSRPPNPWGGYSVAFPFLNRPGIWDMPPGPYAPTNVKVAYARRERDERMLAGIEERLAAWND